MTHTKSLCLHRTKYNFKIYLNWSKQKCSPSVPPAQIFLSKKCFKLIFDSLKKIIFNLMIFDFLLLSGIKFIALLARIERQCYFELNVALLRVYCTTWKFNLYYIHYSREQCLPHPGTKNAFQSNEYLWLLYHR